MDNEKTLNERAFEVCLRLEEKCDILEKRYDDVLKRIDFFKRIAEPFLALGQDGTVKLKFEKTIRLDELGTAGNTEADNFVFACDFLGLYNNLKEEFDKNREKA